MKIDLDGHIGLIVCHPTGVTWTSQTGGMSCHHPEAEGFFVPLDFRDEIQLDHNKGQGKDARDLLCCGGETEWKPEDLAKIEELLHNDFHYLDLDRDRLKDMEEAWIPVILARDPGPFSPIEKCIGLKGWLIYNNCD